MLCEKCNGVTDVTDTRDTRRSRPVKGVTGIPEAARWRRMKCRECGHKMSTYEFSAASLNRIEAAPCDVDQALIECISEMIANHTKQQIKVF